MQPSDRSLLSVIGVVGTAAFALQLFAPAGRWWGVDAGATGAVFFLASLAAFIALLAVRADRLFPDAWSPAERRARLGLVFLLLIAVTFAKYLWLLSLLDAVPEHVRELPGRRLLVTMGLLAVASMVSAAVISRGAGPIREDERDARIRLAADRAGDTVLVLMILFAIILMVMVPASHDEWLSRKLAFDVDWWLRPLVLSNLFIAGLLGRTLVERITLIVLYARGRA